MEDWKIGWQPRQAGSYLKHLTVERIFWGPRMVFRYGDDEFETLPELIQAMRNDVEGWFDAIMKYDRPEGSFRIRKVV